jgi:hypothetical protein
MSGAARSKVSYCRLHQRIHIIDLHRRSGQRLLHRCPGRPLPPAKDTEEDGMEFAVRFFAGGVLVSLFALLGDAVKPKSFAGLFGAAPSVALATLALAILTKGENYAALEARSMITGALAFFVYASASCRLMAKSGSSALSISLMMLPLWFACAACGYFLWLR